MAQHDKTAIVTGAGTGIGKASALALVAAFWLSRFPISREQHEARVAARRSRDPDAAERDPLDEAARADPDGHTITP